MNDWDESEHPRDRRGRFTDSGGWVGAVAEAMGFDETLSNTRAGRASLLRRVRNDLEGAELAGDSGQERHVTFYHPTDGGRAVVRARYRVFSEDDGDDYDDDEEAGNLTAYEAAQKRDNEIRAALVAEAIGAPVPATIADPDDPHVTLMTYVVGDNPHDRPDATRAAKTDEGIRLGLFDLLVNNNDRGPGPKNWIMTPLGTPVGIDHTQTMEASSSRYEPNDYGFLGSGPFVRTHFTEATIDWNGPDPNRMRWIDNPLHPDDIPELKRRIDQLAADGVVEGAMLRHMDLVLQHIGPRATGTRRLIT